MTTFELNLRKADLFDMIKSMDEESFSKAEKLIKQLCSHKTTIKSKPYPWAPTIEEFKSVIAESEANYRSGKFIEEEDMDYYLDSLK